MAGVWRAKREHEWSAIIEGASGIEDEKKETPANEENTFTYFFSSLSFPHWLTDCLAAIIAFASTPQQADEVVKYYSIVLLFYYNFSIML